MYNLPTPELSRATAGSTSPADEMVARIFTANLDRLAEAMPDVVDTALRETLPHRYTPELAQKMAAEITARLRRAHAPRPLTAAQRGTEWMLRWGCPAWCVIDHRAKSEPEWHATAGVETDIRAASLDSSGYSDNGVGLPWLAAKVVVANDKPQAYGRTTEVFLDYGVHTAELSVAQARLALVEMRSFVAELEAVVDMAEAVAGDDFEGDPEIAAADREAESRRIKRITEASA